MLPQLWFRNTWSWKADAPSRPFLFDDGDGVVGVAAAGARRLPAVLRRRRPSCCSARTRPTPAGCSATTAPRARSRTRSTTTSCAGDADAVNPDRSGTKAAAHYRLDGAGGRRRRPLRLRLAGVPATRAVRRLRRRLAPAPRRGRRVLRRAPGRASPTPDARARAAAGLRRHDLEQAVLPLRRPGLARRRPDPAAAARRAAATAATATGGTSTTPTSSRCRTSGSTPGTPPGTWPSTASRSRWSTPSSPRTSSCC